MHYTCIRESEASLCGYALISPHTRYSRVGADALRLDLSNTTLRDGPTVIVVPVSLLSQWTSESRHWLRYGQCDIFVYGKSKDAARKKWWEAYNSSCVDPCHRIILVPQTVRI